MSFSGQRQIPCVVTEARTLANFLIDHEKGRAACGVATAIYRVAQRFGFDHGVLHSLRYRSRELHDVQASVLERLRAAFEYIYERSRKAAIIEQQIDALVGQQEELKCLEDA